MVRHIVGAIAVLMFLSFAQTAQAAQMGFNFSHDGNIVSPGTWYSVEGMFFGEDLTNDDAIKFTDGEVTGFMASFYLENVLQFSVDLSELSILELEYDLLSGLGTIDIEDSTPFMYRGLTSGVEDCGIVISGNCGTQLIGGESFTTPDPLVITAKISEPATFGIFAIGLAGLGFMTRQRKK